MTDWKQTVPQASFWFLLQAIINSCLPERRSIHVLVKHDKMSVTGVTLCLSKLLLEIEHFNRLHLQHLNTYLTGRSAVLLQLVFSQEYWASAECIGIILSKGGDCNLHLKVTRSWLRGSAADLRPLVVTNETYTYASSRFPTADWWYRPLKCFRVSWKGGGQ